MRSRAKRAFTGEALTLRMQQKPSPILTEPSRSMIGAITAKSAFG
jgi:hypothetical protein